MRRRDGGPSGEAAGEQLRAWRHALFPHAPGSTRQPIQSPPYLGSLSSNRFRRIFSLPCSAHFSCTGGGSDVAVGWSARPYHTACTPGQSHPA